MTRIRRDGLAYVTWVGDHGPRHVHVFRDGRLIAKWDLVKDRPMQGDVPRRVAQMIRELQLEGLL
jgi:hypothetical protein